VLVVEHERGMWSTHADILRVAGYTVIQANAGDDALRMLQHMRFDAIVLDVTVPDAEVVALLTMVAAPPPVVMLSSIDFDDEPRLRLARKAVAHLHKPVPPAELVGAVARAMRRADL
jgi:DNA-binding response OmpR family regulator